MENFKQSKRLTISGGIFGMAIGAALAMVQIVFYMLGNGNYSGYVANTPASNDVVGLLIIPFILVVVLGAAGAFATERYARRMQRPKVSYV